ncbi:MAG: hypothetical protein JO058_22550 [Alphaproteobacteria bacterium]|nr:hypothetical protein [Alphaproteobacteria bacterium]MBV9152446.1 hypothetical protein [Alphaproteobacteria bacterium]
MARLLAGPVGPPAVPALLAQSVGTAYLQVIFSVRDGSIPDEPNTLG